jgi:N-carbamoyl-L-amino-acid hydrolase
MCMTDFDPATVAAAVAAQTGLAAGLFHVLRADSLDEPGVTRDPYGPGEQRAHATLTETAVSMGLHIEQDHAANTYMTLPGRDRSLPRVIIGSHLDSVPHGGNFDGAAGVIAGIVAVAALKQLGITLPCDLTVMAIRAEESVWFQVSYIGSRGALGTLPDGALDVRRRDTGRTLAEHIRDCGGNPEALAAGKRFLDPATIRCYLEVHIEQAPSLVEAGRAVALCTGIPGTVRYPDARIEGQADHVGTPRRFRRDAALAGAEFAMALDALWQEREAAGVPMAWTLGKFHTDTATHDQRVDAIIAGIEQRRGVKFHRGVKAGAKVGPVDPMITAAMESGAAALGIPVLHIGSPASHDGAAFAAEGVPMVMLFVRNENGSHNPREAMEVGDFMEACKVLTLWLVKNVS